MGKISKGELPPDICIELALWERFGWGPKDTEDFTLRQMREMFAVLEQQRVSKDAQESLGNPSEQRRTALLQKLQEESNEKLNNGEISRPVEIKTPRQMMMEAQNAAANK